MAARAMDSIPVVAITGQVDTKLLGRDAFQETDILDVTMPVTKHNYKVKDPKKLIPTLREAFHLARSGRPGPVLVDIPRDLFLADIEYPPLEPEEKKPSAPDADFLICAAEAAEVICQAKRPVVIAGGGVISAGATKELIAFAEKFHLPVCNTLMGIGSFPRSHPQALGFAGMHEFCFRVILDPDGNIFIKWMATGHSNGIDIEMVRVQMGQKISIDSGNDFFCGKGEFTHWHFYVKIGGIAHL